jgi:Sulfatase
MPRNLVMIILDSCRFDSFTRAAAPNMNAIGQVERRWAYASWTAPSHFTFLMGLVPHLSPQHVYASEVYKKDFATWTDRLGIPDLEFASFIPQLSLPKMLKDNGYRCVARVSMPVLNSFTILNKYFDDYKLMANHFDFAGMLPDIEFSADQPSFFFLNLGETHYPYMLEGSDLPHISGLHGVAKSLAAGGDAGGRIKGNDLTFEDLVSGNVMTELHAQQVRCVDHVDLILEAVFEKAPPDTYFIVMGDHGDAFGEGGYFGHGPVMHEKVFEVPFLEGTRP